MSPPNAASAPGASRRPKWAVEHAVRAGDRAEQHRPPRSALLEKWSLSSGRPANASPVASLARLVATRVAQIPLGRVRVCPARSAKSSSLESRQPRTSRCFQCRGDQVRSQPKETETRRVRSPLFRSQRFADPLLGFLAHFLRLAAADHASSVVAGAKVGFSGPGLEPATQRVSASSANASSAGRRAYRSGPARRSRSNHATETRATVRWIAAEIWQQPGRRCDGRGFFLATAAARAASERRLVGRVAFSRDGVSAVTRHRRSGAGGALRAKRCALPTSVRRANCPVVVRTACFSRHALSPPVSKGEGGRDFARSMVDDDGSGFYARGCSCRKRAAECQTAERRKNALFGSPTGEFVRALA